MRRADLTEDAYRAAMSEWQSARAHADLPRLFRHPLLDALTRTPPWSPYVLAGPLAIGAGWMALREVSAWPQALALVPATVAGALTWSLLEYLLHRFAFHARPSSETGRIAVFLAHGHHHVAPNDRARIAATPIQMGSALLLLAGIADLALDGAAQWAATAGAIAAYLVYEAIHYAIHHGSDRARLPGLRALRRHHLAHHHVDPRSRWGISSPLWDVIFGSRGARR